MAQRLGGLQDQPSFLDLASTEVVKSYQRMPTQILNEWLGSNGLRGLAAVVLKGFQGLRSSPAGGVRARNGRARSSAACAPTTGTSAASRPA